jgi:hypothetical protein
MTPTVEDAARFLADELGHGEPRWSADVKAAGACLGFTPKMKAQAIVPVWHANAETFPRRTVWWLERSDHEEEDLIPRDELVEQLGRTIRDYFDDTRNDCGMTEAHATEQQQ